MIQLQFLNALLNTNDSSLLLLNDLSEDFFSDYKDEYKFIVNHLNQYGRIPDITTFLSKFPDFDIIDVNESKDYLIDALFEDRDKRFLAKTFNEIRKLLTEDKTEEAMQLFAVRSENAVKAKHLNSVDITKDTSRYNSYVDKCQEFNKFFVKTGFKELDQVIGGWDRQEELATIVARPGVGKSWVLLKCAVAALEQGLKVGIYSGEMSETKVGYRFDTLVSHLSNYGITKGNADLANDYKSYIDKLPTMFNGSLKVLTPAMIDGAAGVTALRAFVEKEDLDILCIDQHSLLEDDRHARNPVDRAANISRDLKQLQVLKKIPIIAISQQNRTSTESGVSTSHVAQTDRISQDSTLLLFLEQAEDVLTMTIAKSRDSETNKKIRYAIDLNRGVFNYIPEENNALEGAGYSELEDEYENSDNVF